MNSGAKKFLQALQNWALLTRACGHACEAHACRGGGIGLGTAISQPEEHLTPDGYPPRRILTTRNPANTWMQRFSICTCRFALFHCFLFAPKFMPQRRFTNVRAVGGRPYLPWIVNPIHVCLPVFLCFISPRFLTLY